MSEDGFWDHVDKLSKRMSMNIEQLKEQRRKNARSKGLVGAVEIDAGGKSSYFNKSGKLIYKLLLKKGLILIHSR